MASESTALPAVFVDNLKFVIDISAYCIMIGLQRIAYECMHLASWEVCFVVSF